MLGLKHIPRNSSSKLEYFGLEDDEVNDNVPVQKKTKAPGIWHRYHSLMNFETRRQRFTNRQEVLIQSKLEQLSVVERFSDVDPPQPHLQQRVPLAQYHSNSQHPEG
jgi:hypothetical protein